MRNDTYPWQAFLLHTIIVFLATFLAEKIPLQDPVGFVNPSLSMPLPILDHLLRWDAHWYTYVAEYGYTTQSIVFFPAIIVLIKGLASLGISYKASGFILCNVFAFISFWIMYITFRLDFSEQKAQQALLAYAVMPTSFFLNSIYTEPLFIVFSFACIYCARVNKWWSCSLFASLASLTRSIGILLWFFLLYELWLAFPRERKPKFLVFSLLLPPLALLLFMSYNYQVTGDFLAFIRSQQGWGRQFSWPWTNIWNNLLLLFSFAPSAGAGMALDSILVTICLIGLSFLTFSSSWKIRKSYLLLGWLWFIIPLFSTSPWLPLYSMSRFILVVFPLYLFVAQMPSICFYCYLWLNGFALLLCTALFMNWYWIG